MNLATGHTAPGIDPASLAALPRTPGVYLFWGEGQLPLYIGKSVDMRSRVLAHLRAPDEAAMLAQARRVEVIETAGEIGALLLEARLIKQLSPLYNIRLRRLRNLCAIQLIETGKGLSPQIVSGKEVAVGLTEGLYGLFSSVRAAQAKLSELAQLHRLCRGLLGLEQIGPRGCFGLQLRSCLGACVGQEERQAHDQRLLSALLELKVQVWPYPGAIDLVEQNGDWVQKHRIQGWRHLGTWCSRSGLKEVFADSDFDLDTYKILVKPILLNQVKYTLLTHSNS
ncbi:MAG: Excinuclease cho [Pseudomonadota bacterium]|jgi:excinuclease Cho